MRIGTLIIPVLVSVFTATAANAADTAPQALDDKALAGISAGSDTQTVTASSTGATIAANTVTSGEVSFANNAFEGFSGIGNIVVNTGNANVIQGSLQVNLNSAPSP
jgi:hypothetical protein